DNPSNILYSNLTMHYTHHTILITLQPPHSSTLFPYTTLFRSIIMVANKYAFLQITRMRFLNEWEAFKKVISRRNIRRRITIPLRSEERFSRNAETDLVCRLLLEKKKISG